MQEDLKNEIEIDNKNQVITGLNENTQYFFKITKKEELIPEEEEEEEKLFFIDLPNPQTFEEECSPWINVATFSSKQEAIEYAQKYLGADENGMIRVISEG